MQREQSIKYEDSFNFYSTLPKSQRKQYYEGVFAARQNPSPPPLVYIKQYPSQGEFTFQSYKVNYYQLENTHHPQAIVIHLHGLNSHGGTSAYYADIISKYNREVNVYAFDQVNFGRSEGDCRGLISSLENSTGQGEAFVDHLLSRFQEKPKVYLSGSSFGGTIAFKMAVKRPPCYSGLILLSPALRDLTDSKPYLKKLNTVLTWLMPRAHLPLPSSTKEVTKYNCDEYIRSDPHYYKQGLVPASISSVLSAMDSVSKQYSLLTIPYLVFQGGVDKSVDLFAPVDLANESPSEDKQTIYFKNMWHSVFYEQEIESLSILTAKWLQERR